MTAYRVIERGAKFAPDKWETGQDVKHRRGVMSAVGEQQVLDALRSVRDVERGGDVVSLGMVSGLAAGRRPGPLPLPRAPAPAAPPRAPRLAHPPTARPLPPPP